jgi:YD repeat-containing protein
VVAREEGGTTIRFEHDTEDRLVAVVNEAGERYAFELDEAGRVRAETGFDGRRRWFRRD